MAHVHMYTGPVWVQPFVSSEGPWTHGLEAQMSSRDSQVPPAQPSTHVQTAASAGASPVGSAGTAHVPPFKQSTDAHRSLSSQVFPVQPVGQLHAAVVLLQLPWAHLKDESSQTLLSLQVGPKYPLASEQSQVYSPENFVCLHLPPWRHGAAAHVSTSSVHVLPVVPVLHVQVKVLSLSVPSAHVPPCLHGLDQQWPSLVLAQVAP